MDFIMFGNICNVYQLSFNVSTSMKQPSESKEDLEKFVEEIHDYLQKLTGLQIKILKFEKIPKEKLENTVLIDMQISSNNAEQLNKIKHILLENENKIIDDKPPYLIIFNDNEDDGKNFSYNKNLSYFEFAFQYKFAQKFKFKLDLLNLSMNELYELINYWFKKATPELFYVDNNTLTSVESIDKYLNEWQHFIRNELHCQYVQSYWEPK